MNTLKEHLAFLLPLIALLFSLESILFVERAVSIREDKLSKNYAITIVSRQPLSLQFIRQNIPNSASLTLISPDTLLERLKQNFTQANIANLKKSLPLFYSLKLAVFPTLEQLDAIHKKLLRIPGVEKVEVFSKTHDQEYRLLLLLKKNTLAFASIVVILSILLLIKQISVWNLKYAKRIEIMELLGAPMRIKNGFLFKLALVDSILASVLVALGSLYLSMQEKFQMILQVLEIDHDLFIWQEDLFIFLSTSISVSLVCVWVVVIQRRAV
ncbi:cell division protein FtsX [Helicobacter suis]|uniref:cell division protein FtsX n=1 Tax=Helicobacter suis TaxID=104628 RepID=UPI0013D4297E|nr:cell division protein FtsX [Helicobacter suis]